MRRAVVVVTVLGGTAVALGFALWLGAFARLPERTRALALERIGTMLGRELTVGGEVELNLSLRPTVVAHDVAVENAPWAQDRPFFEARRVEATLALLPLVLNREIEIDQLAIQGAALALEQNSRGEGNWQLGREGRQGSQQSPKASDGANPSITDLVVSDSRISWRGGPGKARTEVQIQRLEAHSDDEGGKLDLTLEGGWLGMQIAASGTTAALSALADPRVPWPVEIAAQLGSLDIHLEGEAGFGPSKTALDLSVRGEGMADLAAILPYGFPELGPFSLSARLTESDGSLTLQLVRLAWGSEETLLLRASGTIGDLQQGPRADIGITAVSESLDAIGDQFDLLLPSLGAVRLKGQIVGPIRSPALSSISGSIGQAGPLRIKIIEGSVKDLVQLSKIDLQMRASSTGTEAALGPLPPLPKFEAAGRLSLAMDAPRPKISGTVSVSRLRLDDLLRSGQQNEPEVAFSSRNLPLKWLDALNLDLSVSIDQLQLPSRMIGPVEFIVDLQDGRLALRNVELTALGGEIRGAAKLAVQERAQGEPVAKTSLRLSADEIELQRLLPPSGMDAADLQIDIDLEVDSTGRSLNQLLSNVQGQTTVAAGGGRLGGTQLDRLVQDLDLLGLVIPGGKDSRIRVNCLVGEMQIEDGVAETNALLDTKRMRVLGRGTVDLGRRQLDLVLDPEPKSRKLSTTGVPVEIEGSLAEPKISLRGGETAARILTGVLGGLLVPLNQLTALIGPEASEACASALERAHPTRGSKSGTR